MTTLARGLGLAALLWWSLAAAATLFLALAEVSFLAQDSLPQYKGFSRLEAFTGNARYLERREPALVGGFRANLRAAVRLNPYQSSAWMALGLAAERDRDWREASQALAAAERADHQYLPAWTRANFAFRRGDAPQFWQSARRAAGVAYGVAYDDMRPLLDLADRWEADPLVVLDRLGGGARLERGSINFLIGKGRLEAAQTVALRLVRRRDPGDRMRLLDLIDRLIPAGAAGEGTSNEGNARAHGALVLWNALEDDSRRLDPGAGRVLDGGDFAAPPGGTGFTWRLPTVAGVLAEWQAGRMRFHLSGDQPERCVLLEQPVILAQARYRLRFEYRLAAAVSGLEWSFGPQQTLALAPSASWKTVNWVFQPRTAGLRHLQLIYQRETGTTRGVGQMELGPVHMEIL